MFEQKSLNNFILVTKPSFLKKDRTLFVCVANELRLNSMSLSSVNLESIMWPRCEKESCTFSIWLPPMRKTHLHILAYKERQQVARITKNFDFCALKIMSYCNAYISHIIISIFRIAKGIEATKLCHRHKPSRLLNLIQDNNLHQNDAESLFNKSSM